MKMKRLANFAENKMYRYQLWRIWNLRLPRCLFIMLNPSTADDEKDDPTVAKCIRYAQRWGYGSLEVCNLFAYRATDPRDLKAAFKKGLDIKGRENTDIILTRCMIPEIKLIVAAWGSSYSTLMERGDSLARQIRELPRELHCLRISKDGHPEHPLYLPGDLFAMPYNARGLEYVKPIFKKEREMVFQIEHLEGEHDFKGYGIHPSKCKVHIFVGLEGTAVILEDLNIGTSVTNACEQLANEVLPSLLDRKDPASILWIEKDSQGDFARCELTWSQTAGKYIAVTFRHLTPENAEQEVKQRVGTWRMES